MAKVVKKAAKKKGGRRPGAGRPRGSRSVLPQGTKRALKAYSGIPQEALNHPQVVRALKVITEIMEGKHANRHVQTRLQAATMVFEIFAGKPTNKSQIDTGPSLAELLAKLD